MPRPWVAEAPPQSQIRRGQRSHHSSGLRKKGPRHSTRRRSALSPSLRCPRSYDGTPCIVPGCELALLPAGSVCPLWGVPWGAAALDGEWAATGSSAKVTECCCCCCCCCWGGAGVWSCKSRRRQQKRFLEHQFCPNSSEFVSPPPAQRWCCPSSVRSSCGA